ncbi:MAG: universal stress protein [Desulfomonile tiedjei]|uniref:Universal stress protein n=1 Tax=Desulfomonile tiedjei TaxID=2358 RepID=A0A9D6V753_9BACT|nr:universal stress protein [Desulfomonile tiedjei]
MKKIKRKLTAMLNAVTFAEAGEHGTAIECLDETIVDRPLDASTSNQGSSKLIGNANLVSRAEDQMVAATFAEAGEFSTALEILRTRRRSQNLLLILDGRATELDAFMYAVNLCRRMQAGLEVIAVAGEMVENDVSTVNTAASERMTEMSRLAAQHGVSCVVSMLPGYSNKDLLDYMRKHKEIAAVIYSPYNDKGNSGRKVGLLRILETIVERFSIPLVKVLNKQATEAHAR